MVSAFSEFQKLKDFKPVRKNQWIACCPAHDDKTASLSIATGEDDRILLHCHAGCSLDQILKSIGLEKKNLFSENGNKVKSESKTEAVYEYLTSDGTLSYRVVRLESKNFRQCRPDGNGGWIWNTEGIKHLPYNLPDLVTAEYIFIVEGEKDVENLRKIGLTATCNAGGAGKWTEELNKYFRSDQYITILPDNDEPGKRHAELVAKNLNGKVASIKILKLEGLPEKGDISDWLQGRDPETAAEELSRLSEAAPEWEPRDAENEKSTGFQPPAHWELLDVANVDNWQCAPLKWIIEHIAAMGNLIFVAADSQCGKTLLALYIVLHLLKGGQLFDRFKITPPRKVLYLLLEDPSRRAKARIMDMRRDIRIEPGRFLMYVAPGLMVNNDIMFAWLKDFIQSGGFDFVILDTYQKATPGVSSFDDVKQGPILHRLANLARELNVTLWIHDHYRKEAGTGKKRRELDPSSMKGTGGKPQNADAFILMERTGDTIKVAVSSKDSDRRPRFMLKVSPEGSGDEKFQYAGDLEDIVNDMKLKGEVNRSRVYEAVGTNWTSKAEVKIATRLSSSTVGDHLAALCKQGKIEKTGENKSTRYRRPTGGEENRFRSVE